MIAEDKVVFEWAHFYPQNGEETKWIWAGSPSLTRTWQKVVLHSRNTFDVKTKIEMVLVDHTVQNV